MAPMPPSESLPISSYFESRPRRTELIGWRGSGSGGVRPARGCRPSSLAFAAEDPGEPALPPQLERLLAAAEGALVAGEVGRDDVELDGLVAVHGDGNGGLVVRAREVADGDRLVGAALGAGPALDALDLEVVGHPQPPQPPLALAVPPPQALPPPALPRA